ncbi:hypothetical protein LCGC14_0579770 [marine sediment metagenome]|uniref:Uncharacterized protein n=1 Tax=marine sediment metagenome TaxID=412755 RepID=A0A0F9RGP2_9ZZZZ
MNKEQKNMIEEFQCPGCVCGLDTTCLNFKFDDNDLWGFRCKGHAIGTTIMGIGHVALGLPKGFARINKSEQQTCKIRFHLDPIQIQKFSGKFNIVVWAMEKNGYFFMRTYSPRVDRSFVDVVKGKVDWNKLPGAFDVNEFIDDMD